MAASSLMRLIDGCMHRQVVEDGSLEEVTTPTLPPVMTCPPHYSTGQRTRRAMLLLPFLPSPFPPSLHRSRRCAILR
jgi:hypothetical protein